MLLDGRVAIVTGAARGIGRAIARRFAEAGARVAVADLESARGVADEIAGLGLETGDYRLDITDAAAVGEVLTDIEDRWGSVDILVNNAGIIARESVLDLTHERWRRVFDVNVHGTFNCCKAVIPGMVRRRRGCILNITSIAGKMGDITASPAYGSSKGAINTLTKSLARQLAEYNVRVNGIAPHAIETDMSAEWSAEKRRNVIEAIPLHRMGTAVEVAEAALFLVSDGAAFITGEILDVNGGYLMD